MAEQAALERLLADLRSPIDESALSESFSDVGLEDLLVAAAAGDGGSDGDGSDGNGSSDGDGGCVWGGGCAWGGGSAEAWPASSGAGGVSADRR
mmetsp:Transcript_2644/g.9207  ORF Transcript_2644/g.9207 Transcript_2644/m.9207 type:complete len:94 (+) Transcript_2644:37-318(+)